MPQTNTEQFKERIKPYLKPRQVVELNEEHNQLERSLSAPAHISGLIQDKPAMFRQLSNIRNTLQQNKPQIYEGKNIDLAKKREAELVKAFTDGMPTQEEMRRNPPGAVDKHRAWEKRNKEKILEWKNIRKRLQVSGALDDCLPDSIDISNIEMYRPSGGAQQLNLEGAQIAGKQFYMDAIPKSVVFSDQELSALKENDPELASMLSTLPAETRSEIKTIIKGIVENQDKKTKSDK